MPRKPLSVIDRLLPRCVESASGCWIFQGAKTKAGYGVLGAGARAAGIVLAHRVTYEYFVATIPHGLDIDHLCRVRACCNPWHLEPVSRKENIERGDHRTGWSELGITHCKRGHKFTPESTGRSAGIKPQRYCRTCRRELYRQRRAAA